MLYIPLGGMFLREHYEKAQASNKYWRQMFIVLGERSAHSHHRMYQTCPKHITRGLFAQACSIYLSDTGMSFLSRRKSLSSSSPRSACAAFIGLSTRAHEFRFAI